MTLVGKILVFLNLVFAGCFLAFSLFVYQSRVDYQAKLVDKDKAISAEKTKAQSAETVSKDLQTKLDGRTGELAASKRETEAANKAKDALAGQLGEQLNSTKTGVTTTSERLNTALEEVKKRTEEVNVLRDQRADLITRNAKLTEEITGVKDDLAQRKNELEIVKAKNIQLLNENSSIRGYVQRKNLTLPSADELADAAAGQTPPPEVEGMVRKVDGKFIEISLGADDGIKNDHTLQIWRVGKEPKYLGTVRVAYTTAKTAVVKPVSVTGPILENDKVGPSVLINR